MALNYIEGITLELKRQRAAQAQATENCNNKETNATMETAPTAARSMVGVCNCKLNSNKALCQ